jgi:hypothetical protein
MGMAYIRTYYRVPAKRGGRVRLLDERITEGTIVGATNSYIRVRPDDGGPVELRHPTWEVEYLTAPEPIHLHPETETDQ